MNDNARDLELTPEGEQALQEAAGENIAEPFDEFTGPAPDDARRDRCPGSE